MKDEGALKPTTFNIQSFIEAKEKKADIETISDDEKILAQGADKAFWRVLKKHFDNSIATLESINEQAIAGGMAFDEIGRNALVISQVRGVLRRIINQVEDSKEASDARQK